MGGGGGSRPEDGTIYSYIAPSPPRIASGSFSACLSSVASSPCSGSELRWPMARAACGPLPRLSPHGSFMKSRQVGSFFSSPLSSRRSIKEGGAGKEQGNEEKRTVLVMKTLILTLFWHGFRSVPSVFGLFKGSRLIQRPELHLLHAPGQDPALVVSAEEHLRRLAQAPNGP